MDTKLPLWTRIGLFHRARKLPQLLAITIVFGSPCTASSQPRLEPHSGPMPHRVRQLLPFGNELWSVTLGGAVSQSTDRGVSWKFVGGQLPSTYDVEIDKQGKLITISDGIVHRFDAEAAAWSPIDSTPPDIFSVVTASGPEIILWAGYITYFSTDGGVSWRDSTLNYYAVSPTGMHYNYEFEHTTSWSSSDQGKTWIPFNHPGGKLYFSSDGMLVSINDSVMRSSEDQGVTWTRRTLPILSMSSELVIDSSGGFYFYIPSTRYLFHSSDTGITWQPIEFEGRITEVAATPWSAVHLVADNQRYTIETGVVRDRKVSIAEHMIHSISDGPGGTLWASFEDASGDHGVAVSGDRGSNWVVHPSTRRISGLQPHGARISAILGRSDDTSSGVYFSDDLGKTWTPGREFLSDTIVTSIVSSGGVLFASTQNSGVWRTTDQGATWTRSSEGIANDTIHALATDEFGGIIAASANGLFFSSDGGGSWQSMEAPGGLPITRLALDSAGRIYAGTTRRLYYTDDRKAWNSVMITPNQWSIEHLVIDSNQNVYAASNNTSWIYVSSDRGSTWTQVRPASDPLAYQLYDLHVGSDGYVFAGSLGLHRMSPAGSAQVQMQDRATTLPSLRYGLDGFSLSAPWQNIEFRLELFDQAGRIAFTTRGSSIQVLDQLRRFARTPAWYGYVLRSSVSRSSGSVVIN